MELFVYTARRIPSALLTPSFQVPQFILDDMIESGRGGYCNIICTQPRRIAVSTTSSC